MSARHAARLAVLACLASLCPAAYATAVYSTIASSVFAFSIPVISGEPPATDSVLINSNISTILTGGNGTATNAGSPSASPVRPVATTASASGSAFAPPYSFAQSARMTGHVIKIVNPTSVKLAIPFTFDMSWSMGVGVDDVATESASAGAFFSIAGIDSETLTIAGLGVIIGAYELQIGVSSTDPVGGMGGSFGGLMVSGSILVDAMSVNEFSVITDVAGRANAGVVGEPATLMLIGVGLGFAMSMRRRRQPPS